MKLPDYKQLGNLPNVRAYERIPSYSAQGFTADVGEGIRKFGEGITTAGNEFKKKADEEKNESDTLQRAQADADFRIGSMKSFEDAANDPDFDNAPKTYRSAATEHLETAAGNIADNKAKELFRIRGRAAIEGDAFRLERQATGRRRDQVNLDNDGRLDELGKRAVLAPDEASQASIIGEGNQLIDGSVRAGYLTPAQGAAKKKAFTQNYAAQFYSDKVERDPNGVLEDFKKFEDAQPKRSPVLAPTPEDKPQGPLRDYGAASLPFEVPAFAKGMAIDRLKGSDAWSTIPKALQTKFEQSVKVGGTLSITKDDLDQIPIDGLKTIFRSLGLAEPTEKAAPKPTAAKSESASAIVESAQRLGISPRDLAAVISYETGGKFDPDIMGGKGGRYMGLIQFGPSEREKYGVKPGMTFKEQMGAVEGFLRDRGLQPGSDVSDIYRTVNGGNPFASLNASDGNGTIAQHIEKIKVTQYASADRFLGGAVVAAAEPARSGTMLDFLPPDKLLVLRRKAEEKSYEANATQRATVDKGIADDLMSVRQTGDGTAVDPNVISHAFGAKGPEKAVQYQETRRLNRDLWFNTNDFGRMTSQQIVERLATLEPKPGDGMAYQSKLREAVQEEADAVFKLRSEDPARAVMTIPAVQQAFKNAKDPASKAAAIETSLRAQADIGIPEDDQTPATKAEATELAKPLHRMLPGTEAEALREVAQTVQERYPDHADRVFEQVVRSLKFSNEVGTKAARVLRKLGAGELPTRAQEEAAEREREIGAANRAVTTTTPAPAGPAAGAAIPTLDPLTGMPMPAPGAAAPPADQAFANVPARAIQMLRSDPSLAEQFDAKFGKGAAKKVLELGVKK